MQKYLPYTSFLRCELVSVFLVKKGNGLFSSSSMTKQQSGRKGISEMGYVLWGDMRA